MMWLVDKLQRSPSIISYNPRSDSIGPIFGNVCVDRSDESVYCVFQCVACLIETMLMVLSHLLITFSLLLSNWSCGYPWPYDVSYVTRWPHCFALRPVVRRRCCTACYRGNACSNETNSSTLCESRDSWSSRWLDYSSSMCKPTAENSW